MHTRARYPMRTVKNNMVTMTQGLISPRFFPLELGIRRIISEANTYPILLMVQYRPTTSEGRGLKQSG